VTRLSNRVLRLSSPLALPRWDSTFAGASLRLLAWFAVRLRPALPKEFLGPVGRSLRSVGLRSTPSVYEMRRPGNRDRKAVSRVEPIAGDVNSPRHPQPGCAHSSGFFSAMTHPFRLCFVSQKGIEHNGDEVLHRTGASERDVSGMRLRIFAACSRFHSPEYSKSQHYHEDQDQREYPQRFNHRYSL
jgi:hypothetical protein